MVNNTFEFWYFYPVGQERGNRQLLKNRLIEFLSIIDSVLCCCSTCSSTVKCKGREVVTRCLKYAPDRRGVIGKKIGIE